jgi:transketolase
MNIPALICNYKINKMNDFNKIDQLKELSKTYRQKLLFLANKHTFGLHLGGSLSLSEILTVLYFSKLNIKPDDPKWPARDRVILSKGHANIGLMTILSMRGFFPFEDLENFNQFGSIYTMHADARVPGVEHSSGSLGHGVTVAVGMALAAKYLHEKWKVYCIVGDGEMMEGSVWESFMSAANFHLDNLTYIIDRNRLSQESLTEEEMALEPLEKKLTSFGLSVCNIDGHDIAVIMDAMDHKTGEAPKAIIANTKKGYGVPGYEGQTKSHFAHLKDEEYQNSLNML